MGSSHRSGTAAHVPAAYVSVPRAAFPRSKSYTETVSFPKSTIQYSRTPASWYSFTFRTLSIFTLEGDMISMTQSGAPWQPFWSSLSRSQITEISGST